MGPICVRCRGANTPGAEFCRFCGTPLAGGALRKPPVVPAPAAAPVAPPGDTDDDDEERETVVAPVPTDGSVATPAAVSVGPRTIASSPTPVIAAAPTSASKPEFKTDPMPAVATPLAPDPQEQTVTVGAPAGLDSPTDQGAPVPRAHGRKATDCMGAASVTALAQLTTVLRDGTDGRTYPLVAEQTDIGREEGNILLPDDPYICPRHARILRREGKFFLRDLDSVNGIYVRIEGPVEIRHGDAILAGQELLVFEVLEEAEVGFGPAVQHGTLVFGTPDAPRVARLRQVTTEGVPRDLYHLHRPETIIGREVGDIVFTDDAFLSRRHAAVTLDARTRRYSLRDMESSNGTFLRFRGERDLHFGDRFRLGQHLFRFDPVSA
jgi:pSer/pThr/pTyr-binding forkhead associated (FHA) protein